MVKPVPQERNYTILNRRLSKIMKERGITISQLSGIAGVAVGTIQKLMTDPTCNPTVESLRAICTTLEVGISELLGLDEQIQRGVFVRDWHEALDPQPAEQSYIENENAQYINTTYPVSKQAFALKMKGNSMLPLFPEGAVLVFDPQKEPYDNSYVLIKLADQEGIVFKQLLIDEPSKFIRSTNPAFKDRLVEIRNSDDIVATLTQSLMLY